MGKWEKEAAEAEAKGEEFIWPPKRRKMEAAAAKAALGRVPAGPRAGNIEVILDPPLAEGVPTPDCGHGPCLLFERYKATGEVEAFWACAVYRDRKHCRFFLPFGGEQKAEERKALRKAEGFAKRPHIVAFRRLKTFRKLNWQERKFCGTCARLLLTKGEEAEHKEHEVHVSVTKHQLRNPSQLLPTLSHKDKESQYWFGNQTLAFLADALQTAGFDACLCIGAPRLFEKLRKSPVSTFLLDLDDRYKEFWGPRSFAHYSMFADHLYDKLGAKCLDKFLSGAKNLALFVDPPFGGLMGPLLHSLQSLKRRFEALKIFLVAPYFLEGKIKDGEGGLRMLDYQIDYSNHLKFARNGRADSRTPVRLFTSLPLALVPLPEKEGYKFCDDCGHHVAKAAQHCAKCKACVAKSGEAYRHCGHCGQCVKDKYGHCGRCSRCHAKDRPCHQPPKCTLCEATEHKRMDCPLRKDLPHLQPAAPKAKAQLEDPAKAKKRAAVKA